MKPTIFIIILIFIMSIPISEKHSTLFTTTYTFFMFLSFMSYYNLTRYLSGITFIEFLRNLENSMKNAFIEKLIHMNLSIPANETFLNSKEYHYENMKKDIDLIGTQKEEIDDFSKSSLNNVFLFSSLIHFFIIFQVIHFSFMLSDSYIENISNVIFLGIPVILLLGVKYESGKLYSLLNKVSCNMIDTKEQEKEISLLEIEKIALLKKEISIFNDVTVNNNFFMFVFYFSSLFFISYINVLYDFESSHFFKYIVLFFITNIAIYNRKINNKVYEMQKELFSHYPFKIQS